MKRHSESLFTSLALALLLALTLFYGCRAFDPEPVIVNRAPQTYIIGAPAETTGSRFLRHMYWYGTDNDGEVVRFIYAITDSTVQDPRTDIDEEDARFNPATDVTTLEPQPWRVVGYTAKTDSIFLFTVDRADTPSKEVTFHVVAVDDRGAIDPTPARLQFLNNSLGNPVLKFTVSTEETVSGQPTWITRWIGGAGTGGGPIVGESPELSVEPYVGFARKFRIQWEGSSPNGMVTGYRFKANQNANASYVPPLATGGAKQWDPALTSFVFANDQPPDTLPDCEINPITNELSEDSSCPPESVRWPSDRYALLVEAIDEALVQSEVSRGELRFNVNYPPDTEIVDDATWPIARWAHPSGVGLATRSVSEHDTIPHGAYMVVNAMGQDRTPDLFAPATYGPFCCDTPLATTEVRFQALYRAFKDDKFTSPQTASLFSSPYPAVVPSADPDTIGVNVGPMEYNFLVRATDEHRRSDVTPDTFHFYGGFRPRVLSTRPANGDVLLMRTPLAPAHWPGSLPYEATTAPVQRWWNGIEFVDSDPCVGLTGPELTACQTNKPRVDGNNFVFSPRFEARVHPDEAQLTVVKCWTFSQTTDHDPLNVIVDGFESEDRSFFYCPSTQNLWDFSGEEAFQLFIPTLFWFQTDLYDPSSALVVQRAIGEWLARRLGESTMVVQARTTAPGDTWPVYAGVRPDPAGAVSQTAIAKSGRRSYELTIRWGIYLGIGGFADTTPTRVWPDFDIDDYKRPAKAQP